MKMVPYTKVLFPRDVSNVELHFQLRTDILCEVYQQKHVHSSKIM